MNRRWIVAGLLMVTVACTRESAPPPAAPTNSSPVVPLAVDSAGIYTKTCAICHMADGSGVPNMQPPLAGSPVVAGDPNLLIRLVLLGSVKVLPEDRKHYANVMPSFSQLDDEQIAAVLTYVRSQYGGGASAIDHRQVAAVRSENP